MNSKRNFITALLVLQIASAPIVRAAPEIQIQEDQRSVESLGGSLVGPEEFEEYQAAQVRNLKAMSPEEVRLDLELQAAQLDQMVRDRAVNGQHIDAQTLTRLSALSEGIKAQAADPHVKRKLLRSLMVVPRVIAQGIGYAGLGLIDLFVAPIVFTGPLVQGIIAGEGKSKVLNVAGFTGRFITHGATLYTQVMMLGLQFPLLMMGTIPIVATIHLICGRYGEFKSPHTERFCEITDEKPAEIFEGISEAGLKTGIAINRVLTAPVRWMVHRRK
jgi:hypothetical protein